MATLTVPYTALPTAFYRRLSSLGLRNTRDLMALLWGLSQYANQKWECWPSQERLASDLSCSAREIRRDLQVLSSYGFIEVSKRGRMNVYRIVIADEAGRYQETAAKPVRQTAGTPQSATATQTTATIEDTGVRRIADRAVLPTNSNRTNNSITSVKAATNSPGMASPKTLLRTGSKSLPREKKKICVGQIEHRVGIVMGKAGYSGSDGAIFWKGVALHDAGFLSEYDLVYAASESSELVGEAKPKVFRAILKRLAAERGHDLEQLLGDVWVTPTCPKTPPVIERGFVVRNFFKPVEA